MDARVAAPAHSRSDVVANALIFAVVIACANGCRCGKEPTDDATQPAFTLRGVSELEDLRHGPTGFLVAAVRADGRSEAISVDDAGAVRWRSSASAHVLLGASTGDPVFVMDAEDAADGGKVPRVSAIDAASGKVGRSFAIEASVVPSRNQLSDAATLFAIGASSSTNPPSLRAVDAAAGRLQWHREPTVDVEANELSHPTLAVFTNTSVRVFCAPRGSTGTRKDLCRFARADGSLTSTYAGPVIDVAAAESPAKTFFALRYDSVEARSDDDVVLWKRTLPDGYRGDRVVAGPRFIAVIATLIRSKSDYQEQLFALDATDGHELFMKDSGGHGEHFQSQLAIGGEQLVYLSNIAPNVRVVDNRGDAVFGAVLTTQLVISTEVAGTFVETLRGDPFLVPPFLALPRKEQGLEVYALRSARSR